jgi:CBS domain-containing protein
MEEAMAITSTIPVQHVYHGRGVRHDRAFDDTEIDDAPLYVPTIADLVPVTEIMTRKVTCASRDLSVDAVIELMVREHIGSLPVVDEAGGPVGMLTKQDLVEQLLVGDTTVGDRAFATANELMMPLALSLGEHATVAHAAALMAAEDVHHVPIVDANGRLIGIVSTMDVVRWLATNDGFARRRA